jgi:hypothetical protein
MNTLRSRADERPVFEADPKRKIPYFKLHEYLLSLTPNKLLAKGIAIQVHSWIMAYYKSRRTLKVRKLKGHVIIESATASKRAVADLERLKCAKGDYAWEKAWHEKSSLAGRAIVEAAEKVRPRYRGHPDFLVVPERRDIEPLVERAIEIARKVTTAKPERDRALIAILRAYRYLSGKAPTYKPAEAFITKIEEFYNDLLPEGFEGWRSKATLQKLISASLIDL